MRRLLLVAIWLCIAVTGRAEPLPKTKPLTHNGDLAMQMVEGIDKYLMRELEDSPNKRKKLWKGDISSPQAYEKSVLPHREHLKRILGVVDDRVKFSDLEFVGGPDTPSLVAETDNYKIHAVRWPVFPGVFGEGLLLEPKGKVIVQVVALPDADHTPEMIVGLAPGIPKVSQYARRLAVLGCRVIVPVLIDRKDTYSGNPKLGRMTNQPHREFIYRMAYEMGRHIIGYEVQKVLAAVDWMARDAKHATIAVAGCGEGALIAMHGAEIDTRVASVLSIDYWGQNKEVWKAPIYRNVWSLLPEFDTWNGLNIARSSHPAQW